jgi:hypothetical protein
MQGIYHSAFPLLSFALLIMQVNRVEYDVFLQHDIKLCTYTLISSILFLQSR